MTGALKVHSETWHLDTREGIRFARESFFKVMVE
jgi:hypothetical protein